MSNADYVLANQSGAAFRAELNTILGAISSMYTGAHALYKNSRLYWPLG